jgi:hypothetical protein
MNEEQIAFGFWLPAAVSVCLAFILSSFYLLKRASTVDAFLI